MEADRVDFSTEFENHFSHFDLPKLYECDSGSPTLSDSIQTDSCLSEKSIELDHQMNFQSTIMIRNIPNKFTQVMLIDFVNETHHVNLSNLEKI